jgi:Zn-dependent metalloprotease
MNFKSITLAFVLTSISNVYAAIPIDLRHESPQVLQQYLQQNKTFTSTPVLSLQAIRSEIDSSNTTHTRVKQMYAGIPVWGGDFIIHTPNAGKKKIAALAANAQSTMNGFIFSGLENDLYNPAILNSLQKKLFGRQTKQKYLYFNQGSCGTPCLRFI